MVKKKKEVEEKAPIEEVPKEPIINTEEQEKRENYVLRNFFIVVGAVILVIIGFILLSNYLSHFSYQGMQFGIEKSGNLIFYRTSFAVISKGKEVPYNIYIRNDPRELEKQIPFIGTLKLKENLVVNTTGDISCDGYGGIALANLVNLKAIGVKVMRDANATCDSQGRYLFLNVSPGNVSEIREVKPSCYKLTVNNCEVLKVVERFMTEIFIKSKNL